MTAERRIQSRRQVPRERALFVVEALVSLLDSSDTLLDVCHNGVMNAIPVKVGPKGRVVVPAPIRRQLGIEEGTELLARIEGDGIVLEPRTAALRRLQALFAHIPRDVSLVDELLAERREEARREELEYE
jgi:AbrB family looped-hinge helix DNA binding protein